ncbi:hypothetical protein OBBRIDRAFT_290784 [Obba rivulosa]|uniref:Uncharacterized protein n=1 Tax=Obba rivulosa TaxID=1052685 RepID=A0A8E2J2V2_9APHY|nr:hypothetical protein OBBRIDRAFT_290784 [Obba rivulosa]
MRITRVVRAAVKCIVCMNGIMEGTAGSILIFALYDPGTRLWHNNRLDSVHWMASTQMAGNSIKYERQVSFAQVTYSCKVGTSEPLSRASISDNGLAPGNACPTNSRSNCSYSEGSGNTSSLTGTST